MASLIQGWNIGKSKARGEGMSKLTLVALSINMAGNALLPRNLRFENVQ
jgi:hypothetical protein